MIERTYNVYVHIEVQSHPPLCLGRSTLDGFRRCAHARIQVKSVLVPIKFMIGQEKYFVCLMSRRKFTRRFLVQSKLCDGEKIQSSERSTDRVNNPGGCLVGRYFTLFI